MTMPPTPFPRERVLRLAARACKEILVDGKQRDSVLARLREEAGDEGGWGRGDLHVVPVIKHHGLLNFIALNAGRGITGIPSKDTERHFFCTCILFHVFKDRIENGAFPPFNEDGKEDVVRALNKLNPRLDNAVTALVEASMQLDIPALLRGKSVAERWSILYSHPSWLVERLRGLLPDERVESVLRAQQAPEAFFIVAKDGGTLDRLTKFLVSKHIVFQHDRSFANVLCVANLAGNKRRVIEAAFIDVNEVMIQDLASVAVLGALNVTPGDTVIDACAAPFQKTAGIWWRCGTSGRVIATEVSPRRASPDARRLPQAARRAISVIVADAARLGPGLRGPRPDRILLDLPCTGSGSLAAYPELKARQTAGEVAFFSALQDRILGSVLDACVEKAWERVHIVYSTCSYYPEEGEEVIDGFMNRIDLVDLHDPNGPAPSLSLFPTGWKGHACSPRVVRTFPDTNGGSKAFFIAAFTPKA
ncbi:MAG: hypothetical protein JW839_09380 [Candidatus Lokiarchaeota archaeon]|nr:hypothetical protein [Candidatus Lokiarchaeota archaeon]